MYPIIFKNLTKLRIKAGAAICTPSTNMIKWRMFAGGLCGTYWGSRGVVGKVLTTPSFTHYSPTWLGMVGM